MPLKKNEPITDGKLAPESVKTGGVSAVVTPGKRALAVKGDKVIGISGFINPGNRVDVLVTLQDPRDNMDMTKLVLENILVLATGTQIEKNAKGEPAPVDVYTLELTPEEGEKMALAAAEGKLQFALRNVTDAEKVLTKGANIPQTLASLRKAEPQLRRVDRAGRHGAPPDVSVDQPRKSAKSTAARCHVPDSRRAAKLPRLTPLAAPATTATP